MGANDSPITTRSIITDYFDWRLNNRTITNNRLFLIVRKIASDREAEYRDQQPTFNFRFEQSPVDLQTLNNIQTIHREIAREMFADGVVTWKRIITFISFSAALAEHIIQQQTNTLPRTLIISSVIDWTTNFIDTDFQEWLQSQNYWTGCLKVYENILQRRNSIGRYAGILGTIGMLTLGALYMRRS
ncbi:unnamed protein product [Rotaria socialis]|uniref:Bcl-2 Bcl-2 homology region 1-3 domain-containing protein n=2 Tax=Rotaria socialis TaxID=392032 RepID=A0A818B0U2_9BILA|nr:unnamed protein product [Rotaria socialis]CAF3412825.1 unnamed protein product [Rotaria socialis]CAF3754562.1 unnamed protein product [Rotaria socialis]CAF3760667.1 unnamed protein product [Rotaria socialis]CAF3805937.1 unnamed protein product [Rotaria socialis]